MTQFSSRQVLVKADKLQGVSKKVAPKKTFWNIFTSVESFCVKFSNKFAKFHAKRLNRSENIPKSFRGELLFFEKPYKDNSFIV